MALSQWKGTAKVDNNPAAHAAKLKVRELVGNAITPLRVFDGFAGSGQMYRGAWANAEHYVGCDERRFRDGRLAFVADNRRVMRCIDLAQFNVFDLDAYGSPWEQAIIVADRRPVKPGELLGFCFTDGAGAAFIGNVIPAPVAELAGMRDGVVGLLRRRDDVLNRVIAGLAVRMSCKVEQRWEAHGKTGAAVRYIGLVLRGLS